MEQKIRDVMTPDPVTCDAEDTVIDAARAMQQHAIGDVIVLEQGKLCGLVTDRDLVVRVLAETRDPYQTRLRDVCTGDVSTLTLDDDAETAVTLMRQRAIRRIPIVEDDVVVGVVSIGDLAMDRDERSALAAVSAAPPNS